jgi:hypothetical protein
MMIWVFLAAFLALPTNALAATVPTVNTIDIAGLAKPLLNVSSLDAIDRRFTTTTQIQGPALNVDAFLLNVVEAMATYAMLNFTADVKPVKVGSPDVTIVSRGPKPGETVEARFLVWGLYAGIRGLILYDILKTVEFTLKWDGNVVGYIKIRKPNAQPSGSVDDTTVLTPQYSTSPSTPALVDETNMIDKSLQMPDNSASLSVQFTGFGQPLARDGVIITILKALLSIAPKDSEQTVQPFHVSGPAPYDATLRIRPLRPRPSPSAKAFTYAMVSRSLLDITQQALQCGTWSEAYFDVVVDGVANGRGAFVKGESNVQDGHQLARA